MHRIRIKSHRHGKYLVHREQLIRVSILPVKKKKPWSPLRGVLRLTDLSDQFYGAMLVIVGVALAWEEHVIRVCKLLDDPGNVTLEEEALGPWSIVHFGSNAFCFNITWIVPFWGLKSSISIFAQPSLLARAASRTCVHLWYTHSWIRSPSMLGHG